MRFLRLSSTRLWVVLSTWTLICAAAFVSLAGAEDSSRPKGRISPYFAEIVALDHLVSLDRERYARFETVDSAIYRDPASGRRVWLVLCDDGVPSRLTRAVVVEVDAASGAVIRTRRPGGVPAEGGAPR